MKVTSKWGVAKHRSLSSSQHSCALRASKWVREVKMKNSFFSLLFLSFVWRNKNNSLILQASCEICYAECETWKLVKNILQIGLCSAPEFMSRHKSANSAFRTLSFESKSPISYLNKDEGCWFACVVYVIVTPILVSCVIHIHGVGEVWLFFCSMVFGDTRFKKNMTIAYTFLFSMAILEI